MVTELRAARCQLSVGCGWRRVVGLSMRSSALSEEVVDQNANLVSDPTNQNGRNIAPWVDWNCGGAAICMAELFV
jgi:hypothetical protein